jgi:uncharacterized protein involved in response to NO
MTEIAQSAATRKPVPRGLSRTGPVLFSYGFRPFFLGAGLWAMVAMILWIGALTAGFDIWGDYGALHWHAHEMLFGFSSAVLAGFLLTAVPNWTGRLPVSGRPLVLLFGTWCAGRLALLLPDAIGAMPAAVADSFFLPLLLFICAREIVAGRKWKDLKVLVVLAALSAGNILYHVEVLAAGHPDVSVRLAISAYVGMVMLIGGRIVPSFTRNWLSKAGKTQFPAPYGMFDSFAIVLSVAALVGWVAFPDHPNTALAAFVAVALQAARLSRWKGLTTFPEKLLFILHVGYGFVPLGFAAIGLAALGQVDSTSALHVLTVGTIAVMMLAVMTRATRGHTGRVLTASRTTILSYSSLVLSALLRPLAGFLPDYAHDLYAASGTLWIVAFALFLIEYGPMLLTVQRKLPA